MRISWTPRAFRHLGDIHAYIARSSPSSAGIVAERILAAIERLGDYPSLGRPGRSVGTRELVIHRTPILVIYRHRDYGIEILTLLHGAQRWPGQSD